MSDALTHTFKLLARKADEPWLYQDKVFALMTPSWSEDGKQLTLDYTRTTPTATLDNKLADELNGNGHNVHAVQRIRNGSETPNHGEWLISGGLLLSNPHGELITFERTVTSPSGQVIAWPKALNNPMGRVDTLPQRTCYKEGAEEISILHICRDGAGVPTAIIPKMFRLDGLGPTGIAVATEQALQQKTVQALAAAGTPFEVPLAPIQFISAAHDPRYNEKLTQVTVRADGAVVDAFKAVAIPSPAERTIEMAIPLMLDPGQATSELLYIAREPFGRAVKMATPLEMEAMHYAWAKGLLGSVQDPQQNRTVHLGGILPILQGAVLGLRQGVSRPDEVQVPATWPDSRIKDVLKL